MMVIGTGPPPDEVIGSVAPGVHAGGTAPEGAVIGAAVQARVTLPVNPSRDWAVTVMACGENGSVAFVNPWVIVIGPVTEAISE